MILPHPKNSLSAVLEERIENKIFVVRGQRVMMDRDLSDLYEVSTKRLNEQVRRNRKRFPVHFMFRLSKEENDSLRSQIATLNRGKHSKYLPHVFTEHGVTMLASVLNSDRAIQVNIQIIETFISVPYFITKGVILVKAGMTRFFICGQVLSIPLESHFVRCYKHKNL